MSARHLFMQSGAHWIWDALKTQNDFWSIFETRFRVNVEQQHEQFWTLPLHFLPLPAGAAAGLQSMSVLMRSVRKAFMKFQENPRLFDWTPARQLATFRCTQSAESFTSSCPIRHCQCHCNGHWLTHKSCPEISGQLVCFTCQWSSQRFPFKVHSQWTSSHHVWQCVSVQWCTLAAIARHSNGHFSSLRVGNNVLEPPWRNTAPKPCFKIELRCLLLQKADWQCICHANATTWCTCQVITHPQCLSQKKASGSIVWQLLF